MNARRRVDARTYWFRHFRQTKLPDDFAERERNRAVILGNARIISGIFRVINVRQDGHNRRSSRVDDVPRRNSGLARFYSRHLIFIRSIDGSTMAAMPDQKVIESMENRSGDENVRVSGHSCFSRSVPQDPDSLNFHSDENGPALLLSEIEFRIPAESAMFSNGRFSECARVCFSVRPSVRFRFRYVEEGLFSLHIAAGY